MAAIDDIILQKNTYLVIQTSSNLNAGDIGVFLNYGIIVKKSDLSDRYAVDEFVAYIPDVGMALSYDDIFYVLLDLKDIVYSEGFEK
jgi:hypothetical protein